MILNESAWFYLIRLESASKFDLIEFDLAFQDCPRLSKIAQVCSQFAYDKTEMSKFDTYKTKWLAKLMTL